MIVRRAILALGLGLAACQPVAAPPALAPAPSASRATDQANLLLFPQTDAESLLGRAAQRAADGSWTIADARAPGCQVSATHDQAAFHAHRTIQAHSLTSLAGGWRAIVSIDARFGRDNAADIEIDNTEVIRGDMRGMCGDLVVDTVFVGHGKRTIHASAETKAAADVQAGVGAGAPKVEAAQSQDDALAWTDDQAYGFTVLENAKVEPFDVRVDLPSLLDEGSLVRVRFESARPAWLVVYYLDANGHGEVLWPSNEEPEPRVTSEAPLYLPSARESARGIAYKATLSQPGRPSRETLVVYAFANQSDFDALKPAAGAASADGPAYAAELTKKLQNTPMSRWSRSVAGYVIQPRR
jgi:hypothetical protein